MSIVNNIHKKNRRLVKIYVDFDGTISRSDVIDTLLEKYADKAWLILNKQWLNGEISSCECLTEQIALLKDLPDNKILETAKKVGIDESFKDFCSFCKSKKIDIEIVSDGLDIYIKYLLKINGLKVKKINSNTYKGKGVIKFPNTKKSCNKNCGNCKKFYLDSNYYTIYIGDGFGDRCAAMSSDMVFAKNSLAKYLKKEGKEYIQFRSFTDIISTLSTFLSKRTRI